MAPVLHRQLHHSFSMSRLSGNPHARPIKVTRYISLRVLIQLFVGTVCIFVLAVLFWKIGKFLRSFTRHRVVRGGKVMHTRYARTWYGWVPFHRHESKKQFFRKCFQKIHDWTAWKSSSADYRWIWWDPGQRELERYRQRRRLLWLPKCMRSRKITPADAMWNPGLLVGRVPIPGETTREMACPQNMDRSLFSITERPISRDSSKEDSMTGQFQGSDVTTTHFHRSCRRNSTTDTALVKGCPVLCGYGKIPATVRHSIYLRRDRCLVLLLPNRDQLMRTNFSTPCLPSTGPVHRRLDKCPDSLCIPQTVKHERNKRFSNRTRPCARVYQKWSARMECQTTQCIFHNQGPIHDPPGSPNSELLASFTSERTVFLETFPKTKRRSVAYRSSDSINHTALIVKKLGGVRSEPTKKCFRRIAARQSHIQDTHHSGNDLCQDIQTKDLMTGRPSSVLGDPYYSPRIRRPQRLHGINGYSNLHDEVQSNLKDPMHGKHIVPRLSTWELRLMTDLNRKLNWLVNQFSPGRRPFHFALLANHWLNRETWVVLDPVSRVSGHARRQCGDPRFNSTYPIPTWQYKAKYPAVPRTKCHRPHISSWRIAVNRNRRMRGLQSTVKSITLCDGSADEAPDGKVDPASWILRRPPQGFAISTRQNNVYYEGGAGWQETLSDWQKVRRGYRIRKAIYEGRANRTRMKELVTGILRYCQTISAEVYNNAH